LLLIFFDEGKKRTEQVEERNLFSPADGAFSLSSVADIFFINTYYRLKM